jgi:hypothetical protein
MSNSLDVDGVFGPVSSINLINDDIYVFQPKGIARLMYKERIQTPASDGVSISLSTGYNTPDYRYLTNQYGCSNKFSIIESKSGVFFYDSTNKLLGLIADGIIDVSTAKGMKS